jgi:hypothetical protein
MSTPEGFFDSMNSKGISKGHWLMNFTFSQTSGVKSVTYSCDNIFTKTDAQGDVVDPSGFTLYKNQGWCSCSNCAYNCSDIDFKKYLTPTKITDGMKEPYL